MNSSIFMATEENTAVGCLGHQAVCVWVSLPAPKLVLLNAWRQLLGCMVPDRNIISVAVAVALSADGELKNDSQSSDLPLWRGLGPPQVCFDFFGRYFKWNGCGGGAGQRKDLHEDLGAAGLLMASVISAGSKFHNLGPAPVDVLFLRVMSLFPLLPSLPPLPKLVGNFIVPVEYICHVRSLLHKER